jgi:hypothetical protein
MPACAGMTVAGWFEIELAGKAPLTHAVFHYDAPRFLPTRFGENPN